MSTTTTGVGAGFRRVTIVAPDSRIDVALPEEAPLADIYPEILRLSGQAPVEGAPVGYHLVRRDGSVLSNSRSFAAERILDGEVLTLRPFAESLPPAVFDDVSDAVASAVARDRTLWGDGLTRGAGLTAGTVVSMLAAFVLWFAAPVRHDMHSPPGILAAVTGVLLVSFAAVRARVHDDRGAAMALGLGAIPHVMIAGSGLVPLEEGGGIGRLQFLLGCIAVLVVAVVLIAVTPSGDAPFVAAAFAATVGTLVTFVAILTGIETVEVASLCVPVALGVIAFLPDLSVRFARLPAGYTPTQQQTMSYEEDPDAVPETAGPVDAEQIAAQARRGHEMLVGLVGGCAVVVLGASAVLGFSDSGWGHLLAVAGGLAMLLRARLFRYAAQVGCAVIAGVGALALLVVGLALNPPASMVLDLIEGDPAAMNIRATWLTAALVFAAALASAIALIVPKKGVAPFWARFLEIFEMFVLLTPVPICLAVMGAYSAVRSMTG
ncbi:hypothetical protein N566_26150 [Streptomycetaceae bacterium MP113-05]|nr:hypothetical protein N566_26150 [Streptomycetaceae bacterium MP113-05]